MDTVIATRKQPHGGVLGNLYVRQPDMADQLKQFVALVEQTRHDSESRTKELFEIKEKGNSTLGTEKYDGNNFSSRDRLDVKRQICQHLSRHQRFGDRRF